MRIMAKQYFISGSLQDMTQQKNERLYKMGNLKNRSVWCQSLVLQSCSTVELQCAVLWCTSNGLLNAQLQINPSVLKYKEQNKLNLKIQEGTTVFFIILLKRAVFAKDKIALKKAYRTGFQIRICHCRNYGRCKQKQETFSSTYFQP